MLQCGKPDPSRVLSMRARPLRHPIGSEHGCAPPDRLRGTLACSTRSAPRHAVPLSPCPSGTATLGHEDNSTTHLSARDLKPSRSVWSVASKRLERLAPTAPLRTDGTSPTFGAAHTAGVR